FCSSPDLLSLHSFPTRRSSDLSDEVEAVTTLALFIPLVIDTGGNAGSQASTVVTRALAVGELRFSDLPWVIWREARVGLLMGFLDRKSTRLNSSHVKISYAVFC